MLQLFNAWYRRYFSDPQAILLAVVLFLIFALILVMGRTLAPVLAAIVIAYLLEGPLQQTEKWRIPRPLALTGVLLVFVSTMAFLLLGLLPVVSQQVTEFFQRLPSLINDAQQLLSQFQEKHPDLISQEQIGQLVAVLRTWMTGLAQYVFTLSFGLIPAILRSTVYLILGALLVFFFLKDKVPILEWITDFLPRERALFVQLWRELDEQLGNYIRGKFNEILIVGAGTYAVFTLLGFRYATLLAVTTGLSVLIPFIGAAVVTLPVAFAGYVQWGWSTDFLWVMIAYGIIQALDGYVLAPMLFSEALKIHPSAIIVAILVFGDLWGFWGVFFAIPLATLVKALLNVWPRSPEVLTPSKRDA